MHRRGFLQTAGLGAAAAMVGRSAAAAAANESQPAPAKQLPKRSEVKPSDTWDLSSLFPNDQAWEAGFCRVAEADRGLCRVFGPSGRKPREAGGVPPVRSGRGPRRRPAGHVRHAEDGRGPVQQRLSADAGPLYPDGQPRRPGLQLHPPGDSRHPLGQDGRVPPGPGAFPLQAPADAHPAIQAAHVRRERREAAGHADRDGPGGRTHLPPTERHGHQVRHGQE